ncbi:hypothetical protein Taro_055870 [Colocasia esculenta]|uniref:Pectate lyase n=1 Tax=Colocasia esculenta TaxID=4460 RepID=A0A843XUN4_COLES|nr:hypothetical protein [Colocasia esculenta]
MERALQVASGVGGDTSHSTCYTGNPIDDCWLCDADWRSNRKRLADCVVGFGHNAVGGRDGQEYVVNDSSDDSPSDPKPGTLRHAAMQTQPLWIVFASNMTITLSEDLLVSSFKTIDGRGADVYVTGAGCFYLKKVNNVIIHNIHIHDCVKSKQDGDGITVRASRDVWIDHCTLWSCHDGLIDVTHASTGVTISNNHFHHHVKVMLLGHSDRFPEDAGMQVTVAFNRFGEELAERMPRCRFGFFHVVNNDYVGWTLYAVGGSSNPTINSQGNRFAALAGADQKEVTRRMHAGESEWRRWDWRSQGDLLQNGAIFTASGDSNDAFYQKATSIKAFPAALVGSITKNAGVLG